MTPASQIRINALLLEREALWVRVHELEAAAAAIFGAPYPFTRPELPSDQRGKRKSGGRVAGAKATVRLRKLEPGEAGYRVTYRQRGAAGCETHDDVEAIHTLLAAQGANLTVERVVTVDADAGELAVLWAGETAAGDAVV